MIFTPKEAAQLLGISVKNLHDMANNNMIPHFRTKSGWLRFNSIHISELSPTLSKSLLGINSGVKSGLSHELNGGLTTDLTKQLTTGITREITTELNYHRPSRIITAKYKRGEKMFNYNRNAQEALNLGSGLPWEIKGLLSILVDIMAIHDNNGIPCDPPIYICGMLSIGQRKWTTVVLPALINAKKLKKVRRGGIEVYVWHDHNLMVGPRALVQEVAEEQIQVRPLPIGPYVEPKYDPARDDIYSSPAPRVDAAPDIHHNPLLQDLVDRGMVKDETTMPEKEHPIADAVLETVRELSEAPEEIIAEALGIVAELQESHPELMGEDISLQEPHQNMPENMLESENTVEKPGPIKYHEEKPDLIPMPTAYDVLGRAGIDVENHPRGQFFWSRVEHTDILKEWLETVPLSEIVVRIDKARIAGRLKDHMNRMDDFTEIVMGEDYAG